MSAAGFCVASVCLVVHMRISLLMYCCSYGPGLIAYVSGSEEEYLIRGQVKKFCGFRGTFWIEGALFGARRHILERGENDQAFG